MLKRRRGEQRVDEGRGLFPAPNRDPQEAPPIRDALVYRQDPVGESLAELSFEPCFDSSAASSVRQELDSEPKLAKAQGGQKTARPVQICGPPAQARRRFGLREVRDDAGIE